MRTFLLILTWPQKTQGPATPQHHNIESDINKRIKTSYSSYNRPTSATGAANNSVSSSANIRRRIQRNADNAAKRAIERRVVKRFSESVGIPEKGVNVSSTKLKEFLTQKELRDLRNVNRYTAGFSAEKSPTSHTPTLRRRRTQRDRVFEPGIAHLV